MYQAIPHPSLVSTSTRSGVGNDCNDVLEETRECNIETCYDWTEWSEWTECTSECGGGTKSKIRECIALDLSDLVLDLDFGRQNLIETSCDGDESTKENCNEEPCPEWTEWSPWSECSASCGGGKRKRGRECANPVLRNGRLICDGSSYEDEICNADPCPKWQPWSEWTECSASCGGGTRSKERECSQEANADESSPCGEGETQVVEDCNTVEEVPCPSDPEWTEWTAWSECSKTCGGGSMKRMRTCEQIVRGGQRQGRSLTSCEGPATMMLFCNLEDCPRNTEWTEWSDWSQCSKTCGGGDQQRSRDCVYKRRYNPVPGEEPECPGLSTGTRECNKSPCSQWSQWGSWGSCSASCGGGTRRRSRRCSQAILSSDGTRLGLLISPCVGEPQESEACNENECPQGKWKNIIF